MNTLYKISGLALFDVKRNLHNKPVFRWYYLPLTFFWWIILFPFLVLQFFGLFMLIDKIRYRKRFLTDFEKKELRLVFVNGVNLDKISITENSYWAKLGANIIKAPHLGFVFLNTIYFSRSINTHEHLPDMAWLVHETTHISQYQKCGIIYIVKALRAQRNGGYAFEQNWLNLPLKDFNFEQQGEIAKQLYMHMIEEKDTLKFQSVAKELEAQKFV